MLASISKTSQKPYLSNIIDFFIHPSDFQFILFNSFSLKDTICYETVIYPEVPIVVNYEKKNAISAFRQFHRDFTHLKFTDPNRADAFTLFGRVCKTNVRS